MTPSLASPEVTSEARQHPRWAVVMRVCNSQCFRSSHRLREFLLYVSDCCLRSAPEEATEQQIGIHVFQRAPGYNSSEDSIVRTHARLLRQKLTEYFATEGADEDVVIEIPKGHYLPVFRDRSPVLPPTIEPAILAPAASPSTPALHEIIPVTASPASPRMPLALGALAILLVLVAAGLRYARRDPVDHLWAPFLADNDSLVIYSNALFTGDSRTGLKYAQASDKDVSGAPDHYVDTYTGVGELASVYDLTQLFDHHHAHFVLKRSMLVTWDEAKLSNLIFIGSVAENPSLRVVPSSRDFTMIAGDGYSGIVNHNPKPGEPAVYQRPEHPFTRDYAILALLPGMQPGKKTLVFSGLTTLGTQAAVEFACRHDTAEQLIAAAAGPKGELRPFEAVLETAVGGGVPLETRLVSIHLH